jgi:hypothetical protein
MRRSTPSSASPLAFVGSLAPIAGVLLAAPAIGRRRVLDDHVLALIARGGDRSVAQASELDLFRFASGVAEENLRLMDAGSLLPWWSDPELKIAFFRPLSAWLHRLDFALWGQHAEPMYAHGLLWLLLLLVLVQRLYARFEARSGVALLAAWLYALNDANGPVVSWLSNRNALVSAAGVVAALWFHDRARRDAHAPSRWLAPASLAFAVFAGELGLSAWAYLLAHALVFEAGPRLRRLSVLWPYALVTLAWLAAYRSSGAGARGSGVYLHPLADPAAFLLELPQRAGVLLGAAFGPLPADLSFVGSVALVPVAVALALALLAALGWVTRADPSRDRTTLFWWLGTLFAVLPVSASFPSDRLLLLVNVGAMALVARAVRVAWPGAGRAGAGVPAARALGLGLLFVHGVLAPILLPWRARQMQQLGAATERAFACLDDIEQLDRRTLVVLGAPADFFVSYLQAERAVRGLPRPEHVYWVANPGDALRVRASDGYTLELEREGGFFTSPAEALYRSRRAPLAPGARIRLSGLEARIGSVDARGAPLRVELRFPQPLTDERFVFLALRGDVYEAVRPRELEGHPIAAAAPLAELLTRSHVRAALAQTTPD